MARIKLVTRRVWKSACIELRSERYDLEGIRTIDHTGWVDMDVPPWLGQGLMAVYGHSSRTLDRIGMFFHGGVLMKFEFFLCVHDLCMIGVKWVVVMSHRSST